MENIYFYKLNEPFGHFSNFSRHSITIDGLNAPTSEHLFQAWKFFQTDRDWSQKILRAETPLRAAKMGRSRSYPLRKDWESVKDNVMRLCVYLKVSQHDDVLKLLLSTGTSNIVEHSSIDSYWADGGDGTGKNKLGLILQEIRSVFTWGIPDLYVRELKEDLPEFMTGHFVW